MFRKKDPMRLMHDKLSPFLEKEEVRAWIAAKKTFDAAQTRLEIDASVSQLKTTSDVLMQDEFKELRKAVKDLTEQYGSEYNKLYNRGFKNRFKKKKPKKPDSAQRLIVSDSTGKLTEDVIKKIIFSEVIGIPLDNELKERLNPRSHLYHEKIATLNRIVSAIAWLNTWVNKNEALINQKMKMAIKEEAQVLLDSLHYLYTPDALINYLNKEIKLLGNLPEEHQEEKENYIKDKIIHLISLLNELKQNLNQSLLSEIKAKADAITESLATGDELRKESKEDNRVLTLDRFADLELIEQLRRLESYQTRITNKEIKKVINEDGIEALKEKLAAKQTTEVVKKKPAIAPWERSKSERNSRAKLLTHNNSAYFSKRSKGKEIVNEENTDKIKPHKS